MGPARASDRDVGDGMKFAKSKSQPFSVDEAIAYLAEHMPKGDIAAGKAVIYVEPVTGQVPRGTVGVVRNVENNGRFLTIDWLGKAPDGQPWTPFNRDVLNTEVHLFQPEWLYDLPKLSPAKLRALVQLMSATKDRAIAEKLKSGQAPALPKANAKKAPVNPTIPPASVSEETAMKAAIVLLEFFAQNAEMLGAEESESGVRMAFNKQAGKYRDLTKKPREIRDFLLESFRESAERVTDTLSRW